MTDARTLSLLSRAQTSSNLYDEAFKTANRCQETVRPAIDKPNPTYEARLVDASCHLRAAQAAVKSEDTEGRPYKLPEALQSASAAKLRFDEWRLAPGDVAAIEGQAAAKPGV